MPRHLTSIALEAGRITSISPDHLAAPVPSLPDWSVERVVRHLGKIAQWVDATLASGSLADAAGLAGMPKGPACIPAYEETVIAMLATFDGRDPDEPCETFDGPGTVGWWARRQAQEIAIHRVDAQDAVHAAGGPAPDPIEADLAADGIDEWARFFLAIRWNQRVGPLPEDLLGRTVHIHGTEGDEWLITLGTDGVEVEATHAKGDVALRGPAADLVLALWRRRPLDSIDVVGDATVARRLLDTATF